MKKNFRSSRVLNFAAAGVGGFVVSKFLLNKFRVLALENGFDSCFTGPYPRNTGAKSAVTGGSPEDINQMPATTNPEKEGPIYDGSQLEKRAL